MKGVLTKTLYLAGLECPKYLWMLFNKPEEIRKITIAEEFTIGEGNKVGELAKKTPSQWNKLTNSFYLI